MSEPESGPRLRELEERWRFDQSPRVFLQFADELRRHGRLTRAIAVLTEGLEHHPDSVSGMVALGRCLLEADDPARAREFLERAAERDPGQHVANKLLVDCWLRLGEAERAAGRLEICRLLGERDADLEEFERRLAALRRGAVAPPSDPPAAVGRHEAPFDLPAPAGLAALRLPEPLRGAARQEPFGRLHDRRQALGLVDARLAREGIFRRVAAARPAVVIGFSPLAAAATAPALAAPARVVDPPPPAPPLVAVAPPPSVAAPAPPAAEREIFPLASIGEEVEREAAVTAEAPLPEPEELPAGAPTVTLARLYLVQGHLDDAQRELGAVLALRPDDPEARRLAAELERRRAAAAAPYAAPARAVAAGGLTQRKIERLSRWLHRLRDERRRVHRVS